MFKSNYRIGGIIGLGITAENIRIMKEGYDKYKNVEITENIIFVKILKLFIRGFSGKKSNNQVQYRYNLY